MMDWMQVLDQGFRMATDFASLVQKVIEIKNALATAEHPPAVAGPSGWGLLSMQPFTPRAPDPFAGGAQWMPQLQNLAAQFGNPWVPTQTAGFVGIDLTGVWAPPLNPLDQTYIREFGPYLNVVTGIAGMASGFGEGFFVPNHSAICVAGLYITGVPFEARARLLPNWVVQGVLTSVNPFGMPLEMPIFMAKMA